MNWLSAIFIGLGIWFGLWALGSNLRRGIASIGLGIMYHQQGRLSKKEEMENVIRDNMTSEH